VQGSAHDLFTLSASLVNSPYKKMPFFVCCGTEDFLLDANHRFRDHARTLGLNLVYEEEPAAHEWDYWDLKIQRVLAWLPIKKPHESLI
jgi:putative tributyrin esterase